MVHPFQQSVSVVAVLVSNSEKIPFHLKEVVDGTVPGKVQMQLTTASDGLSWYRTIQ